MALNNSGCEYWIPVLAANRSPRKWRTVFAIRRQFSMRHFRGCPARLARNDKPSLRQRDEFLLVARHAVEPRELPIGLGLLDAFLARRDEIPPDVARSVHRRSAQQHETYIGHRSERDRIARAEYQQPPRGKAVACDFDLAGHKIDGALFGVRIDG